MSTPNERPRPADPNEPACLVAPEHEWIRPEEVVGTLEGDEMPGYSYDITGMCSADLVLTEMCRHCRILRESELDLDGWVRDTAYEDPSPEALSWTEEA